jgi:hypothetical protein
MASTKALSVFSCAIPAFPGLTYSRVICNTLGTEALLEDISCAADRQAQVTVSDNPNKKLFSFLIFRNLLSERTGIVVEGPNYVGKLQCNAD